MNTRDDYTNGMNDTNLTPEQAEELIAGTLNDSGFEDLSTVVETLRTYQSGQIDAALVDRIAAGAAHRASNSVVPLPAEPAGRAPLLARSRQSFRRQISTVVATIALVLVGSTSVALAADGASPGDVLYGIDRALENVGIGDGGTQERLSEVEDLVARGEVARGLEHAALTIAVVSDDGDASHSGHAASDALELAAQRAREFESGQAGTTKEGVAALLSYLAGNIGHVDGNVVAELARDIGNDAPGQANKGSESQPSNQGKAPDEPPGQVDKDSESQPSNQGKAPDEPPGQSKKDSEENAPASPPQSNSGNSTQPGKNK